MNRPFYSEYIRHCLRFYSRNLQLSRFKTSVDQYNWEACEDVLKSYAERDRDIIVIVYGSFDTLSDNVYEASKRFNINQSIIWDMMKDVERKIAKARGLI